MNKKELEMSLKYNSKPNELLDEIQLNLYNVN